MDWCCNLAHSCPSILTILLGCFSTIVDSSWSTYTESSVHLPVSSIIILKESCSVFQLFPNCLLFKFFLFSIWNFRFPIYAKFPLPFLFLNLSGSDNINQYWLVISCRSYIFLYRSLTLLRNLSKLRSFMCLSYLPLNIFIYDAITNSIAYKILAILENINIHLLYDVTSFYIGNYLF